MTINIGKKITRGYLLASLLIASTMLVGYLLMRSVIHEQLTDAVIINQAGRQRMLSQKIAKTALSIGIEELSTDEEIPSLLLELGSNLNEFQHTHENLMGVAEDMDLMVPKTEAIQKLMQEIQPHYQAILLNGQQVLNMASGYVSANDSVYTLIQEQLLEHERYFLPLMDRMVSNYEADASTRIKDLLLMARMVVAIGLIVLLLTAVFIFRPLINKTNNIFNSLNVRNQELQVAEEELQATNEELIVSQEGLYEQKDALEREQEQYKRQAIELNANQDRLAGMMLELREKNQEILKLSMVAEKTTNLIIITDAEKRIEWVNPSFEKNAGYTLAEVKGKNPGSFLQGTATDLNTVLAMRAALAQGEGFEGEVLNYTKEGKPYWVQINITALVNDRGTVNGFFAIQRDITKKIESEHKLEEAYKELQAREEELVQQTEELSAANEDLFEARTKAQIQLITIEQLQNAIFKSASIIITNQEGIILEVNDRFCANSGYELQELIGQPVSILDSGLYEQSYWNNVIQLLEKGEGWRDEVCNRGKDGHLYWVDKAINPIYNSEGKIDRYLTIERNITEKKQLEREQALALDRTEMANHIMSQAEGSYQEKLEHALMIATRYLRMELGIISSINVEKDLYTVLAVYDVNDGLKIGTSLPFSDSYCKMMISNSQQSMFFEDITLTQYKNQHCFQLFGLKSYMGIQIKGSKMMGTLNFTSSQPLSQPITHADKNFLNLLGEWVEHIIDQKQHEEELVDKAVKLETANQQANDALAKLKKAQQQLVQSEKMSSLGILTAGLAHEINNPVNFVSGGVAGIETSLEELEPVWKLYDSLNIANAEELLHKIELAKEEATYSETKADMYSLLQDIKLGADRIATIVRNLRLFSHGGTSQQTKANIPDNINATLSILGSKLEHRVVVTQEYEPHFPDIQCNIGEINQVLMNLLSNAADAIEGEGQINIKGCVLPDGENISIAIADTGKGIEAQDMDEIFKPFFSTKKVGAGTGLGLSISYSIIEEHHGRLLVETALGKGTTFKIILPIEQQAPISVK